MRSGGCVASLAILIILAGLSTRQARQKPASVIMQQAAEESIKVAALEACKARLPGLGLRVQELVFRAPGRWQVIRRRQHDQISCATWQGQVQYVDTALIQPGNGVITP